MCACVPGSACVQTFGGTGFTYANKSNTRQERLLLEPLTHPIVSGTEHGTASDFSMVIKKQNLIQGSESSWAAG